MTDSTDPIPRVTRDDPAAGSGDVVAASVSALKALFPSIVTDGRVDFDVLRQLLGDEVEDSDERYGLNWKGKRRARAFALTPTLATLRPAKGESKDWDNTKNVFIEGDNLEVLKCLRRSYAGKVKMIYIDPPYNTGNDFVYPDDYVASLENYERLTSQRGVDGAAMTTNKEGSGRFHTTWLNMMYPRLMLAKELMQDDGLILFSIDDDELDNSIRLLDEIFGADNHIATTVWDKNRKNDAKLFSVGHEYMLVDARSLATLKKRETKWREQKIGIEEAKELFSQLKSEFSDDWETVRQKFLSFYRAIDKDDPRKPIGRFTRMGVRGPYRDDGDISWPGGGGPKYEVLHPITKKPVKIPAGGWVYSSSEGFWEAYERGFVVFGPDETTLPRQLRYLFEGEGQVMISVNFSYAQTATMEFVDLMGSRIFDNPKNFKDIARLVSYMETKGGLILDFFAGSGTTGHAIMKQNVEDDGDRRYILVQLPEPLDAGNGAQKIATDFCNSLGVPCNIAELTKERLRRAGAKLSRENPDKPLDTGFRVYKLASSNLKPWAPDSENLTQSLLDAVNNLVPDRSDDDLLVELLLKTGIDLTMPMETRTVCQRPVLALGGGVLMVYLGDVSDADAEELGQGIADWHAVLNPVRATTFYFRDSGFASAAAKANVAAIIRQRVGSRVEKLASL